MFGQTRFIWGNLQFVRFFLSGGYTRDKSLATLYVRQMLVFMSTISVVCQNTTSADVTDSAVGQSFNWLYPM